MMLYEGDSGGPFYTIKDKKQYLVGITSYVRYFCDEGIRLDKLEIFVYFKPFLLIKIPDYRFIHLSLNLN